MPADDAPHPLDDRLRRSLAQVADTQAPVGDWDALVARHHEHGRTLAIGDVRHPPRRRVLAVAAVVLAVAALAGAALVAARRDRDPSRDVSTATPTTTSSTPSTPTSTSASTTITPAPLPAAPPPALPIDLPWEDLPDRGLLVRDGDEVRLLDDAGQELTATRADGLASLDGPVALVPGSASDDAPTVAITQHPANPPAPAGCRQPRGYLLETGATAGDTSASACSTADAPEVGPREIWLTSNGETTVLSGPPDDPSFAGEVAGHWRSALPSPDGRWVLGQWSGECESPSAWFVPTDGGATVPAEASNPESYGLGWAGDGRALVAFTEGICGSGIEEPGVYAVDPAGGDATLLVATTADGPWVQLWTKATRAAPGLSPEARDAAIYSVEQLLAELRAGDLPGASRFWTGYPEVLGDPADHAAVRDALAAFADEFAWLLDGAGPELTATASVGSSSASPVVTVTVDGAGGGRRSAAFVVGGERPNEPRQVERLPTTPPAASPAEGDTVRPGQIVVVEGLPVEGGARASVDGVEVAAVADHQAGTTRITLPDDLSGNVVLTLSRATPEVSEAFAWWFPVAGE